jgi:AraC-like DNA-binding protein
MTRAQDLSRLQEPQFSAASDLDDEGADARRSVAPEGPRAGDLLQLGFVAPLCLAADDAEQALQAACHFSSLWSRLAFCYERVGHDAVVRVSADQDVGRFARYDAVNAVMIWVRLAAASAQTQPTPRGVHVPSRFRPALRRLLDCQIFDHEAQIAVTFAGAELRGENPAADQALFRLLMAHGERRLFERARAHTFAVRVRQVLERLAAHTDVSAERVGRELGLGIRTLHRRLRAEETSFRKLLTEFQIERCLREFEAAPASAKQVAFALGFADPASFHRAFKRWTGRTVNEYRAAVGRPDQRDANLESL